MAFTERALGNEEQTEFEKHGTRKRRSWRKLHIGMDVASGRIVAAALTARAVDAAAQVGPPLDQVGRSTTVGDPWVS